MLCPSCGAVLPPGAARCPACGVLIADAGSMQQTLPGSSASQSDATIPATPPNAYRPGTPSGPGWSVDPAAPTQQYSFPPPQPGAYGPPPVRPAYNSGEAYGAPPAGGPPPRRGLSRGVVILLAALAVLLVLSGIGLVYYSAVFRPAQLHAEATGTAQTQQTQAANATATANAQTTGTAVAVANATATANAQATAVVVATQTALQNIYNTATGGTPALSDSLANNSSSNWDVNQAQGGGGCGFSGGAYHASLNNKGYYFPCMANNTNFSNFAYQVQMNIVSGSAGGVIFRGNNNSSKFYVLTVDTGGNYLLFTTSSTSQSSTLLSGTAPSFKQNNGQTNLLTVIARGTSIYIYINKQYVGSVTDSTYSSGQIGVVVDAHNGSTNVAFSNARVWRL